MSKRCTPHATPSTQSDMTEVHEAAAAGDSTLIETLLDTGKYDVNGPDPEWHNRTPVHWAAIKGHSESIRLLVEYGATLDVVTDVGWTPAHFAAEGGKILALRALQKLEAPIDMCDIYGDTPKRVAEINGQTECAEFLQQ
ncbi:putative ankyrin repeat domain-containing protein 66 [Apostichopus japonicus]|uniref:Putative ankyrin repeat domain-containing protein 66 n=1 Tax=Stichopus japonicus TaxID=307972 RepID=A0A2G8KI95_STIJA|nr:putative ankyrin repeat domain-containing protein 66 [Apostichopus japonicus]